MVVNLETGAVTHITAPERTVYGVAWSPTGSALAYVAAKPGDGPDGPGGLYIADPPDATGPPRAGGALRAAGRAAATSRSSGRANDTMVLGNLDEAEKAGSRRACSLTQLRTASVGSMRSCLHRRRSPSSGDSPGVRPSERTTRPSRSSRPRSSRFLRAGRHLGDPVDRTAAGSSASAQREICLLAPAQIGSWAELGCIENRTGRTRIRGPWDMRWSPDGDQLLMPTYTEAFQMFRDTDIAVFDPADLHADEPDRRRGRGQPHGQPADRAFSTSRPAGSMPTRSRSSATRFRPGASTAGADPG